MAYSAAAFVVSILINFIAAVIFNKGQSGLEAAVLPVSLLSTLAIGSALVWAKRESPAPKRIGWGLIAGALTSLVLGLGFMTWVVSEMSNSSLG